MIQCATLRIPKGMKKCSFYFYCFLLDFLLRNENITSEECKAKNCLKLYCMQGELQAFEVGWLKNHVTVKLLQMNVLFLTTLATLKVCNSPYMQFYFKQFFVLHCSEVIFSFLIKKSRRTAIEVEIAIFHFLGNPKGYTLDYFFYASHIRHNFPFKLIPISMS